MNKLPMNFDWRGAKAGTQPMNTNPYQQVIQQRQALSGVQGQGELVESLLSHAQLQVLQSSNIEAFHQCGDNAYKFVVETFIKPVLMPYVNMHKIDGNGILYIAKNIQNEPAPLNEGGLQVEAFVGNDGKLHIHPQVVVKAISDMCL